MLNLTTATGGTFACQLNHLWHYSRRGAKTETLKEALFSRLDQFQHYTRRIRETIKRANTSGIISRYGR